MNSIRFCLIGTGRAGLLHARNLRDRLKGADLVAVCDSNPSTLNQCGDELDVDLRFADYREAVRHAEVDAVVIVTPTFLHREIACEAANQGKHVFLEKPMAISIDECLAINEAVKVNDVKLQIGFMRRFDESYLKAKELLDSGKLGRVMVIRSTGRGPGLPPPWIYNLEKSNGILAEVNSHDFDSIRWLADSEFTRVYAEAENFKCLDAKEEWPDFYDNAVATVRFTNGAIGTVNGTCPCHYGYDARMEILCENGVLVIGSIEQHGLTEVLCDGKVIGRAVKSWRNLFKDAYQSEMKHFIECINEDRQPRVSGVDGLKAVEVVVAANQSILKRQSIEIGERETV
ncbi:Gfo/Idh/MocA family oxidoreductase [Bythopirellula polymerisocia]|uniref:Inositol 2-dehydrogenase/D-chiro-inositol 3-dehydrogenase n=1 Tax=Bythopirellula polymerisocia TaxID=2528003 RepID=A0A5C6CAY9_9BACT|nr:Gfo/Idh/MocA family oxidoreductase [Bythopirellula polymerisocia]TWU21388.1 Inositol 2-dehydrogenase/D-chiro-inositol 3-dehydrogenase [Bythopirellula polymerisocia]